MFFRNSNNSHDLGAKIIRHILILYKRENKSQEKTCKLATLTETGDLESIITTWTCSLLLVSGRYYTTFGLCPVLGFEHHRDCCVEAKLNF